MITPVSAVKYYQQVVEYIGDKLGRSAEMVHRTTYDEIDVMLEKSEIDVAFICSSPYVLNNKKFGAELLVAPQVKGEVGIIPTLLCTKPAPMKHSKTCVIHRFPSSIPKVIPANFTQPISWPK